MGQEATGSLPAAVDTGVPRQVYILSWSFFWLFFSFGPSQNFQSSVNADLGRLSLAVLYTALGLCSILAPTIVARLGNTWAMRLSSALYIVYIAANIRVYPSVLVASAAIVGGAAAVLWTAQVRCESGLHADADVLASSCLVVSVAG